MSPPDDYIYIVCATWNAVQCFDYIYIYMQLNTHATAWAQAATWLTFLSVSPSLDFIGVGADVDAGVDVGAGADVGAGGCCRYWC